MKVHDLFEKKSEEVEKLLPVDSISMMLFNQKAGIVKDVKRDKDKTYVGVAHEKSTVKDTNGKPLHLTFDNSTDSGEFEIDSLTPLKLVKGDDVDRAIKKLFVKYEVETKKKVGYVVKGDETYLRELHLGKKLGKPAVRLVGEFLKIIKSLSISDEEREADAKSDTKE